MATTKRETVRILCKSIVTRLENRKAIQFPPRLRQVVQDEVFGMIGPSIYTDEDLRERPWPGSEPRRRRCTIPE